MKRLAMYFFLLLLLVSCDEGRKANKGIVIAEVNGDYLYEADLKDLINFRTNKEDSIVKVKNYIDKWIRRQLLVQQAKKNLTSRQLDFDRKLEDYRNSLIIYAYESELINQKLDTLVDEYDIKSYYDQNKPKFISSVDLVKAVYAVVPKENDHKKMFVSLLHNKDTLFNDSLIGLAEKYEISYFNDNENWIRFDDLCERIPLKTDDQDAFLQKNRFMILSDSLTDYVLRIDKYLLKGDNSPLEIESEKIKNIILNKRKAELIKDLNNQLYENAIKNKEFVIY